MAGIGFELKKILKEGGITAFIKVALAGIFIVAGPWLLSIMGIFLIGKYSSQSLQESTSLFMAVIVYSYAFSLFLFGGLHGIFTRILADLIYENKREEAFSYLMLFTRLSIFLSLLVSLPLIVRLDVSYLQYPVLFKISSALLFAVLNVIWIFMIFISLLKRYLAITLVFLIGMLVAFASVRILGASHSLGGAMVGFAAGHIFILMSLYFLVIKEFQPTFIAKSHRTIFRYVRRYKFLLLAGIFYYWGIWIDKMIFWIFFGMSIEGTSLRLFESYDVVVHFSNLTLIPGLVFFIVILETNFYTHLTNFLMSIGKDIYPRIQEKKYSMIKNLKQGLWEQSFFQAVFTVILVVLAPHVSQLLFNGSVDITILRYCLIAVFFHLLLFTLITIFYYLEFYHLAFIAALSFFLLNSLGSLFIALFNAHDWIGISYLASAGLVAFFSIFVLLKSIKKIDRILLSRS